jgi:hypothetical protein
MVSTLLSEEIAGGHGKSLSQATRLFPSYRKGRPVTLSCVLRWVTEGVRGPDGNRVRLEAARLAGRWITTPQAIARFIQAQTPTLNGQADEPAPRAPSARQRDSARAAAELERLGI